MRRWVRVLLIVAPLLALLLGVPAGVAMARRVAEPLPTRNFIGPRPLFGPPLPRANAQTGIAGAITRVGPQGIVVYTRAKKIAIVAVDPATVIRFNGKNVKLSDLQRGDRVTILGRRDAQGRFHAEIIRAVRPPPPDPPPGNNR